VQNFRGQLSSKTSPDRDVLSVLCRICIDMSQESVAETENDAPPDFMLELKI